MQEIEAYTVILSLIRLLLILKVKKKLSYHNSIRRYAMRRIGMSVEHKDEQL
jgi:hypothetical protein